MAPGPDGGSGLSTSTLLAVFFSFSTTVPPSYSAPSTTASVVFAISSGVASTTASEIAFHFVWVVEPERRQGPSRA